VKNGPVGGGEGGNGCPNASLSLFMVIWYIDMKTVWQKEEEREGRLKEVEGFLNTNDEISA
jgi:hypothetical protein